MKIIISYLNNFLKDFVEIDERLINWIFEGQSDKVVDLFLGQNSIVYAF